MLRCTLLLPLFFVLCVFFVFLLGRGSGWGCHTFHRLVCKPFDNVGRKGVVALVGPEDLAVVRGLS